MPSYRKRPVVIQAMQLPVTSAPAWLVNAMALAAINLAVFALELLEVLELAGVLP